MKNNRYTKADDVLQGFSVYDVLNEQLNLLDVIVKTMFPTRPKPGTDEWETLLDIEMASENLDRILNNIAVWDEED